MRHAEGTPTDDAAEVCIADYRQHAVVAEVHPQRSHGHRAWGTLHPDGPLALLPLGDDYALVFTVPPAKAEALMAMDDAAFLDALPKRSSAPATASPPPRRAHFSLALRLRRAILKPREVWIGNAAQTLHPRSGQGFNLGIRDAWALADTLLTHGREDPGSAALLLARHARHRQLDRHGSAVFHRRYRPRLLPNDVAPCAARGIGLAALDLCPIARRFVAARMIWGAGVVKRAYPVSTLPNWHEGTALSAERTGNCLNHPLYHPALSPIIQWMRCGTCRHSFTEGYYGDEAARLLFSRTNAVQQVGFDLEGQRHISARMIDKVLPYANDGNWLDVGFGNGSLLFTAQEYGFTPVGNLRRDNAQRLAAFGIRTYCEDVAGLRLDFRCSVVSMADVLEHMPFPQAGLRAAHRLLDDNGILLLSFAQHRVGGLESPRRQPDESLLGRTRALSQFSRSRLFALLRETGFEPLRYGVSERYRAAMEVISASAKPGRSLPPDDTSGTPRHRTAYVESVGGKPARWRAHISA